MKYLYDKNLMNETFRGVYLFETCMYEGHSKIRRILQKLLSEHRKTIKFYRHYYHKYQ